MHILGIYFLVALLAGLIAYLGNNMGRKIGRKKMSVLGLRPRHTSNFITTLTGSVIAVATLSLFAIFSEPVRELTKGTRDLEKRVMELTDHRQQLEVKVKELESKVYQGRMVYGVGEPIVLGTLNPSLGPQSLHAQILVTLSAANAQAIVENDTIASQKGEAKLDGNTKLLQCDDAILNEFSRQLENQKDVVGIRVLAAQNCLYHDRVPVILEAMPVKRVFHSGETVTSRTLEPNHAQMLVKW